MRMHLATLTNDAGLDSLSMRSMLAEIIYLREEALEKSRKILIVCGLWLAAVCLPAGVWFFNAFVYDLLDVYGHVLGGALDGTFLDHQIVGLISLGIFYLGPSIAVLLLLLPFKWPAKLGNALLFIVFMYPAMVVMLLVFSCEFLHSCV